MNGIVDVTIVLSPHLTAPHDELTQTRRESVAPT